MTLLIPEHDNYYTLDDMGQLAKIIDMSNSDEWISAIKQSNEMLEKGNNEGKILFLYRGESRAMFFAKTGCNIDANPDPLFDRFFVIGSKAKAYLLNNDQRFEEIRQFDDNRKIEYIFNTLHGLSGIPEHASTLAYFKNVRNITEFKEKILAIDNTENRLTIENFYLAFIHTMSSESKVIQAHSVLISSTRSYDVARSFSNNGYIIAFWLRGTIQGQAIDYEDISRYNELLIQKGLPSLDAVHFYDESEVTIFSAIFPHDIFYVCDLLAHRYIFNPYIIRTNIDRLLSEGINVDQQEFTEKVRHVYGRSIWRRDLRLFGEREEKASI